mgnify:CR=1 FL=1
MDRSFSKISIFRPPVTDSGAVSLYPPVQNWGYSPHSPALLCKSDWSDTSEDFAEWSRAWQVTYEQSGWLSRRSCVQTLLVFPTFFVLYGWLLLHNFFNESWRLVKETSIISYIFQIFYIFFQFLKWNLFNR